MQNLAEQLEPADEPVNEEVVEEKQEEVKPEAEAKPEAEEEKKKDPSEKNVPHGAFHEERERRKQAERELTQLRQNQAVLADRYQQLMGALQQQQPQIPPKDVDPIANMDARIEQAERLNQQLLADRQAEQRRQQAEHNERIFRSHVTGLEQEFAKSTPDYMEALAFVAGRRRKELESAGYAPQHVNAMVDRDAMMIAWDAVQNGRNPAEVIYNMAVNTGYTKPTQKPAAEEKVAALQKGASAAKSLGNGSAPAGMPSMEQIADMDEDSFARFKADLAKKGLKLSDVMQ